MKRAVALFVFVLALGIYAPLGAQADEGDTPEPPPSVFTSFTLNGEESDAELSPDTPEVEISVSSPEEARFTRLYICPEAADPCDGSSAIKFFAPNATTTSFTRSWEGLAVSDEPVEPGVYHLTVRFFRYDIQPEAFEETAPYTVTILGEEEEGEDEEEDLEDDENDEADGDGGDATDNSTPALSTLHWTPFTEDTETGDRIYGEIVIFFDGAEEAVPLNTPGEISIETDEPVFSVDAVLFHIPDPNSPTREFVASLGGVFGPFELTWSTPGVYELDLYAVVLELNQAPLWRRMFGWFFGYEARAQNPELFIETIRFTVLEEIESPPEPEYAECCSSVVFLPGIKGSRLYTEGTDGEEKLWEPGFLTGDEPIRDLFLDTNGASINQVYVKERDILENDSANRRYYETFVAEFSALADDGAIAAFEPVAYDWRLSLEDIVDRGYETDGKIFYDLATSTPYIEQTLRDLARHSQTGKVTIVAHSNGGLVAKKLIERLGDAEAAELIDQVIMIGVPQSGAPQSVGALLFGHKENILPALLSKAAARELAENSPMAHHLLPSQAYFDAVKDINHPVGTFSGDAYAKEQDAYGFLIGNWEELAAFLRADESGRIKPQASDTESANILNSALITYAKQTHDALDVWIPPAGITVHQIAGWGVDTIAGVEFFDNGNAQLATGLQQPQRAYKPIIVEDGDGVVPVPSALMMSTSTENVKRWWINFFSLSGSEREKEHGDFLEISDLRTFIKNIIENSSEFPASILANQPSPNELSKKLRFFLHSPLTLTVLDADGNVAGEYDEFGDVKYVTVPQGATYILSLTGLDTGTFTLEIEELENGTAVASSTLANIPVLEGTTATLTISNGISTASSLSVDVDGDGEEDIALTPQAGETVFYQESTAETEEQSAPIPGGGGPLWSASTPAPQVLGASTSTSSTTIQASIETLPLLSSTTTINNQQEQIIENVTPLGHTPEPQVSVERTNTPSTLPSTTAQAASAISAASQQSWFTEIVSVVYAWIRTTTKVLFSLFEHL